VAIGSGLRNVLLSVDAAQALGHALADGGLPATDAAAARIHALAGQISDPGLQDVADPIERLHVEVVQQAVRAMRAAIQTEIGDPLGIAAGFNALDGN
jgi:predicted lipoprotein